MPAMRTTTLIIAAAAIALSACGGDERAGDTADARAGAREGLLAYARCMRENGVDMPDPQTSEDGRVLIRPGGGGGGALERAGRPAFEKADAKCHEHLDDIRPPELSPEQEQQMRETALAHARCMREQGFDFPDPQFSEDGSVTMRLDRRAGLDPSSPRFRAAMEKCREEVPMGRGGARLEVSP